MNGTAVRMLSALTLLMSQSTAPISAAGSRIVIEAYDFAHIGPKTLTEAEAVASDIFAAAGIDAQWTAGSVADRSRLISDFSSVSQNQCGALVRPARMKAQIYGHAPSGFTPLALGYALPCTQGGVQVTLFADRVEAVSRNTLAAFYRVLGHALAHEIGHVLLRSTAHERSGLMKDIWTKSDWQRASVTVILFTPEQAGRMQ